MLGVVGEFSRGIAWHWPGGDDAQNTGGISKGHQANSGFSAQGTTLGFVRNALRLKQRGAPAGFEDRAGCFYSTFSAIVAQNSIVPDTH
jgi:hypothetical protein